MDTLLEPFDYAFFRHGIAVATLAGGLCGLIGVYVVLRGMSYIGHGLSTPSSAAPSQATPWR